MSSLADANKMYLICNLWGLTSTRGREKTLKARYRRPGPLRSTNVGQRLRPNLRHRGELLEGEAKKNLPAIALTGFTLSGAA